MSDCCEISNYTVLPLVNRNVFSSLARRGSDSVPENAEPIVLLRDYMVERVYLCTEYELIAYLVTEVNE